MSDTDFPIQQLRPLWRSAEIAEGPTSIDIDTEITEFDDEEIASILDVANSHPSYFTDFEITLQVPDVAEQSVIRLGVGLQKIDRGYEILRDYLEDEDAEVHRWERLTSELLADGNVMDLAEYLTEWCRHWSIRFHIDCLLDKSQIGTELHDRVAPDLPLALSIWSQRQHMERWIESHRADYRRIIDTFFPDDQLPMFVFLDDDTWLAEEVLRFYSINQFLDINSDVLEPIVHRYLDQMGRDRELVEAGPDIPIISPSLFTSPEHRSLFDTVFLYSIFAAVADQVQRTANFVEFQIATRRDTISDRFTDEEFATLAGDHEAEMLTDLYSLYERFIEKGTRETYRKLWHRSVTDECGSLTELAGQADDVIRTYEFLEEEAIETNFQDLSDAIQDAHTFTADVTNTVSERTTGLTSEIQKVVLTLLGAVFANVFLVLRWSNVDMVLPFSIFVIAGILGFYFPTIQTRVDELDDIIQESDSDFEVYSETIQEFSDHLFDFSRFEERRDSYLDYAQRRKTWTEDKLKVIFTLLTLVWLLFAIISILSFGFLSRQFIVAVVSLLPAALIVYYHRDMEYYPETFVPFLETGPAPMMTLIIGTVLSIALKFVI
jgi:hypothetical protein